MKKITRCEKWLVPQKKNYFKLNINIIKLKMYDEIGIRF